VAVDPPTCQLLPVGALVVVLVLVVAVVVGIGAYDLLQRRHAVLRNFPVLGHLRFVLEAVGPELRQYIVTDNDQERPFSRDERRWVYTSAKAGNTLFGFGTDNDLERADHYVVVRHAAFPLAPPPGAALRPDPDEPLPCAKVLGASHGRSGAFRPSSIVNVSAMSWGSLSGAAVEALDRGAATAGCLHNTGEGGVSPHHRHGADLVLQIGTGYFGCRDEHGRFSLPRLLETVDGAPVRAIEIKLSQGAKPGLGGMLPAAKVTPEVAAVRGIPVGVDCKSPPAHSAFVGVDGLVDWVEELAGATGLPVGIKSAVGEQAFWASLADRMVATGGGPDFITVDGGEGGTGAAPLAFADHVALPFTWGFAEVYRTFAERDAHHDVVWIGSGKLGLPDRAILAMAMGCDLVNVAREAMLAIGCIQAQRCHTGRCPTGVATQSTWLQRGLDPADKSVRCATYLASLRFELARIGRACGVGHPALVPLEAIAVLDGGRGVRPATEVLGYRPGWGLPPGDPAEIAALVGSWSSSRPPRP
jgi:glutamate synthase domain-containing protein 2